MSKITLNDVISIRNISYIWGAMFFFHGLGAIMQGPKHGYELMTGKTPSEDVANAGWAYYLFFGLYMTNGLGTHIFTARLSSEVSQRKMALYCMLPIDLATIYSIATNKDLFTVPVWYTLIGRTTVHALLIAYGITRAGGVTKLNPQFHSGCWKGWFCYFSALWLIAGLLQGQDKYGGAAFWNAGGMISFLGLAMTIQMAQLFLGYLLTGFCLNDEERATRVEIAIFSHMLIGVATWFGCGIGDQFVSQNGIDAARIEYMLRYFVVLFGWYAIKPCKTYWQFWMRIMIVAMLNPIPMLTNSKLAYALHDVPEMSEEASALISVMLFFMSLMFYVCAEEMSGNSQRTMFQYLHFNYPFWIYLHFSGKMNVGPGIYWDCLSFALCTIWLHPQWFRLPDQGLGGGVMKSANSPKRSPMRARGRSASMKKKR